MKSQLLNIKRGSHLPKTSHPGRNTNFNYQGAAFYLKRLPALLEVLATWLRGVMDSFFPCYDLT